MKKVVCSRCDIVRFFQQEGFILKTLQSIPDLPTFREVYAALAADESCELIEASFHNNKVSAGFLFGIAKVNEGLCFFEKNENDKVVFFTDPDRRSAEKLPVGITDIETAFFIFNNEHQKNDDGSVFGNKILISRIKKPLCELLIFSFVTNAIAATIPIITSVIIDKVIVHHDAETLVVLAAILLFLGISESILTYLKNYLFILFSTQLIAAYVDRLFRHLISLPLQYYKGEALGLLMTRIQAINTVHNLITDTAFIIFIDLFFLIFFLFCMVLLSPSLTAGSLSIVALFAVLGAFFACFYHSRYTNVFNATATHQSNLLEFIHGIESVKTLAISKKMQDRLENTIATLLKQDFSFKNLINTQDAIALFLVRSSSLLIITYGSMLVIKGELTLGQMIAFYVLLEMVQAPIQRIAHLLGRINQIRISVQQMKELFKIEQERIGCMNFKKTIDSIELCQVNFNYLGNSKPILIDVNLSIKPRTRIAITGESGSGKSTLAKLIGGLIEPTSGKIFYDGIPSSLIGAENIRERIAHASQDSTLFNGTVLENILQGNTLASVDQAVQAAKLAYATDFIDQLPSGFSSHIGERGANLSGGQRQRIVLAREFVRDTLILLLDEATNAIDEEKELSIFKNIQNYYKFRTVIYVTHNTKLAEFADVKINIKDGKIKVFTKD